MAVLTFNLKAADELGTSYRMRREFTMACKNFRNIFIPDTEWRDIYPTSKESHLQPQPEIWASSKTAITA
jgi:hypothetical protein